MQFLIQMFMIIYSSLLGKFGGLNRSAIIKFYDINPKEEWLQETKKPKIKMSFENYNKLIEIDFGPVSRIYFYINNSINLCTFKCTK